MSSWMALSWARREVEACGWVVEVVVLAGSFGSLAEEKDAKDDASSLGSSASGPSISWSVRLRVWVWLNLEARVRADARRAAIGLLEGFCLRARSGQY